MSDTNDLEADGLRRRALRTRDVVRNCILLRSAGETVSDQSLINAHPDLMPELAAQLHSLRVIESAQNEVDDEAAPGNHGLHIRCPHCHEPMEMVDEAQISDIVCLSCGGSISLIGGAEPAQARKLQHIGHFQLLEELGVGAFGTVWSAHDTELERRVAVKIPRKGQLDAEEIEKFIREARTAAQLTHPNIIRVFEVGREGDDVYIVTDLVEGQNLADWLDDQQATPREAAQFCATIADALHHAHEHGVIHRDLKPSNIMISENGTRSQNFEPHLMDFGLAKRETGEITM